MVSDFSRNRRAAGWCCSCQTLTQLRICCYGLQMDQSDSLLAPRKSLWLDRIQALLEVVLVAGLLSSAIAYIPFALGGVSHQALVSKARIIAVFVFVEACITIFLMVVI